MRMLKLPSGAIINIDDISSIDPLNKLIVDGEVSKKSGCIIVLRTGKEFEWVFEYKSVKTGGFNSYDHEQALKKFVSDLAEMLFMSQDLDGLHEARVDKTPEGYEPIIRPRQGL